MLNLSSLHLHACLQLQGLAQVQLQLLHAGLALGGRWVRRYPAAAGVWVLGSRPPQMRCTVTPSAVKPSLGVLQGSRRDGRLSIFSTARLAGGVARPWDPSNSRSCTIGAYSTRVQHNGGLYLRLPTMRASWRAVTWLACLLLVGPTHTAAQDTG